MLRTVGKIRNGDEVLIIFDNGTPPVFVDIATEVAEEDGIVRLGFAAITQNGDGIPKADVVVRMRMKTEVAWELCRSLKALQE